jgi:hypothetical protein
MFAEIDNVEDREWFEDNFPDGLMVAFIGDVYCEARNENMDDHWSIAYPVPGDGQTTPSCGYLIMSVQDALNDMTDLKMETYMKAIPAIYGDRDLFDFQAYSKEKAGPGAHYSLKNVGDKTVSNSVWAEPQYALSTDAVEFYKQLFSDIPQFLTGLFPASLGSGDPANETKGGILAMRDASRGQHGVAWKAFRRAYVKSVDQLVRIEAYFKEAEAEDGRIVVKSPGHQETIIELSDLHDGNYCCVPSSDQAFPQTFEEQQETWNKIVLAASQGVQQAIDILNEPKNKIVAKKMIALEGMVIPGAEETEKQLQEIATMLEETPVPIPAATNAFKMLITASLIMGKQPPQMPPPEALFRSSVPIDAKVDKNQIEASACQDWLNSPKGQQIREENPDGFMNVRLHFLAHVKAVQDDQMQQAKMAITVEGAKEKAKQAAKPQKESGPSTSITMKDLGPSGQLQLGAKAGLDLTADVAADLAAETVHGNSEDNVPQPPQAVGQPQAQAA